MTIIRLVENPFKTVKHKHRPPKDVEKSVAARPAKTSSVSSSAARSRKREGRNTNNNVRPIWSLAYCLSKGNFYPSSPSIVLFLKKNEKSVQATEVSKRSSSKAIDGKSKQPSNAKGNRGPSEGNGATSQRSNGYHRQSQGGRQNKTASVQVRRISICKAVLDLKYKSHSYFPVGDASGSRATKWQGIKKLVISHVWACPEKLSKIEATIWPGTGTVWPKQWSKQRSKQWSKQWLSALGRSE